MFQWTVLINSQYTNCNFTDQQLKRPKTHYFEEQLERAKKIRAKKEEYDEAFLQLIEDEEARILRVRSPWIMEDISDEIRFWFRTL